MCANNNLTEYRYGDIARIREEAQELTFEQLFQIMSTKLPKGGEVTLAWEQLYTVCKRAKELNK